MDATRIMLTAAAAGVFLGTLAGTTIGADPKRPLEPAWPHNPAAPDLSTAGYQFTESAPEDLTPPWTLDNPHPLYGWQVNTAVPDYVPKLAEYRPTPLPPPLTEAAPRGHSEPAYNDPAAGQAEPADEAAPAQAAPVPHASVPDQAVAQAVGTQLWSADDSSDGNAGEASVNS